MGEPKAPGDKPCGATLNELGLDEWCQLQPGHTGAHWSRLSGRDGVVFWAEMLPSGGLSVDISLYD